MKNKRSGVRKASKKPTSKTKKTVRKEKQVVRPAKPAKTAEPIQRIPPKTSTATPPPPVKERPSFKINIDRIHGGTVLGDLMVVFPRTREVLKKYGLNLEVDEAGDIYMSLEAFTALKGLKTESLIPELEAAAKEPPLTPATPATPAITIQTVA